MKKNIVFDVGGVLLKFDPGAFCEQAISGDGQRRELVEKVFGSVTWAQMDRGIISVEEGARRIRETLPEALGGIGESFALGWFKDREAIFGMSGLIKRLKDEGYGLYILSNAPKSYYQFRAQLPAIDLFDGEFISCDWQLLKPDPEIFRAFLKHFGLEKEDCFFVDDSPVNVEAALYVGFGGGLVFRGYPEALYETIKYWASASCSAKK